MEGSAKQRKIWRGTVILLALLGIALSAFAVNQSAPAATGAAGHRTNSLAGPNAGSVPLSSNVPGQEAQSITPGQVVVVRDEKHDTSPPLRDMKIIPPAVVKDDRPEQELDKGRSIPGKPFVDPVLQTLVGPLAMPTPITNFAGISNQWSVYPPDTNGVAGIDQYVQMVNLGFRVWDKNGTPLTAVANTNTLWSGFGGPCQTRNDGDPIVLFDKAAGRWLMSQFTSAAPYYQCIAISTSSDATGSWNRYAFLTSNTIFGDYPHYGIWPDAYYMTTNEFSGSNWAGTGNYAFDRASMIAGTSATFQYFHLGVNQWGGMLPADWDGGAPPPAGAPNPFTEIDDQAWDPPNIPQDQIEVWRFHVDWTTPANSTFTNVANVPTAPFDGIVCPNFARNCIAQQGTAVKLDAISDRGMYRAAYRNFGSHEALVFNHTVDVDGSDTGYAGIRWYEMRNLTTGAPTIFQQGTYAPDTTRRWMGSMGFDAQGNIALGFSASSSTLFPSIRYVGRLVGDPLGTLPQSEVTLQAGAGAQTGSVGRWGDYSQMKVDPVDDCTFWYTQEYYATTSSVGWTTRIGSFKFPGCTAGGGTPTPTATGTPPTNTPTATRTSTPVPTSTPCGFVQLLNETFESGTLGTFVSSVGTCVPGGCGWVNTTTNPHAGTRAAFAPDLANISDQYLTTLAPVVIPAGVSNATMTFWHSFNMENTFDGGVLEYSTDGGSTWLDAGALITAGGYNGTISTNFNSPIGGRQAWTGNFITYAQVTVNLTSLAGQANLKIRFRQANDSSVSATGWTIDDVVLTISTTSCGTSTPLPATNTPTRTNTPIPPTNTATRTNTPVPPTNTATATRTNTPIPPTNTPTGTFVPPTNTATGTNTPIPPTNTATRTNTPVPPTNTSTRTNTPNPSVTPVPPTNTPVPPTATRTNTPAAPTNTVVATSTRTNTPVSATNTPVLATSTAGATNTPIPCNPVNFADVPPSHTFYPWIMCLSCRGIINGYPCGGPGEPCNVNNDPYFRPANNITRAQIAKIVSLSAGISTPIPSGQQTFQDVLPTNTFWVYIERLAGVEAMGGYACGGPGEPCVAPGNRPYFRPSALATRGQLTKIVSQAAGYTDVIPAGTQTFQDVPEGSAFHDYVERLLIHNPTAMQGYVCGGPGEPCIAPQNRPYFRPSNNVTRGQASKIVASIFFPECDPAR